MSNSATGNSANAAKNLLNQAQGFAGPTSGLYTGFQNSLGGAQNNQNQEFGTSTGAINNLTNLSTTGGYDPSQLTSLQGQTAGMTSTGGYDPSQIAQINSGYSNLATTGGFTPQQENQFLQRATEGTQATYGALEDQAKRNAVATGGLGTSGGIAQMARQLGQVQGQNTVNAETNLNQLETQNKLAGLSGERGIAGDVAGQRLAAQGQQLGLASDVAGKSLSGTEAAGSLSNQLFNTTTGQISDLGNKLLSSLGLDFQTQEQAASILAQISKNPSMFQSVLGSVAGGLGALGGL